MEVIAEVMKCGESEVEVRAHDQEGGSAARNCWMKSPCFFS
jgi:hypothetical protein